MKFFKRLVSTCYSQIFNSNQSSGNKQDNHISALRLLSEEVRTLSTNPNLSSRFSDSVTSDSEVLRGADLNTFFNYFKLNTLQKTILALAVKNSSSIDKYKIEGMYLLLLS